jgi:hypothetical protein
MKFGSRFAQVPAFVVFAALLASCDSGSKPPVVLHFGMHNWNDCEAASVEVNLEASSAVLARTPAGAPDCWSEMDEKCDVSIVELDGGMRLRVEIKNCFINAYSSLASCRFTDASIGELERRTFATCDCESERRCDLNRQHCDVTPYLCVSESVDPGSCEDCFNGVDDDGNGITDCDDPNCSPSFECGTLGSSTTATCTSTSLLATTSTTPEPFDINEPPREFRSANAQLTAP